MATGAEVNGHGASGLGGLIPSVPPQDLSRDPLVANAPWVGFRGTRRPALNGIPLMAKIGQGAMGAVYYGIHPGLNIGVAIKVLPFHLAQRSTEAVRRFVREAQAGAQIRSPNLVEVRDVREENGIHFLVMEFVRGLSAGAYCRRAKQEGHGDLAEVIALDICLGASTGLAAAHAHGVIHRDIKPDNILVPKKPVAEDFDFAAAKLADLGLAHREELDQSLTGSSYCLGTPGYMSPEQTLDAKTAGKPSDVFSMGATLYSLLAGHPPFRGASLLEVLKATASAPHSSLRGPRPDLSNATVALVDHCLAKDPRARYPDATALLNALRVCRAGLSEPAPTVFAGGRIHGLTGAAEAGAVAPTPRPTPDWQRLHRGGAEEAENRDTRTGARGVEPTELPVTRGGAVWMAFAGVALLALFGTWFLWPKASRSADGVVGAGSVTSDEEARRQGQEEVPRRAEDERKRKEAETVALAEQRSSEARRALDTALNIAVAAKNASDWEQVLTALDEPLKALGGAVHPNRKVAESLLAQARQEVEKHKVFAQKLAEAGALLAAAQWLRAQAAYEEAGRLWPDGPASETRKVLTGMQAAKQGLTVQDYQAALRAGQDALKNRSWVEAEARFRQALAFEPGDEAAARGLADAQNLAAQEQRAQAAVEAKQEYEKAMAEGKARLTKSDFGGARAAFLKAQAVPGYASDLDAAQGLRDVAWGESGPDFQSAMDEAKRLLTDDNYAGALEVYRRARDRFPDLPRVAEIERCLKSTQDAYATRRCALAKGQAQAAVASGDWAGAEAAYRLALAERPDDPEAQLGLATARARQAQYHDAMQSAGLAATRGDWEEAVRMFERALSVTPNDKEARTGLGQAQKQIEDRRWRVVEFALDSQKDWQDSGVVVAEGDSVHVTAEGQWKGRVGGNWTDASGQGGDANWRVVSKDAEGHAFTAETLIGRIGGASPFYVGKDRTFTAACKGNLRFRVNDDGLLGNNQGVLKLTISTRSH